jgi:nucleoside-diphosphate-sugar epimerase
LFFICKPFNSKTIIKAYNSAAMKRILVTGACGQLGSEIITFLHELQAGYKLVASDVREEANVFPEGVYYEHFDVTDAERLQELLQEYNIDAVFHLAAILSAKGEQYPHLTWQVNMEGLTHLLEAARANQALKIFWPSSIAVFGLSTPKQAPQVSRMEPGTMYGITKLAGEHLCNYYHNKFGVDVRSLRYPGLVSYRTVPGGGTTDHAVELFRRAVEEFDYTCFLNEETNLPFLYMPDAVRATVELMQAPAEQVKIRRSYNISGFSATPAQITGEIVKIYPGFQVNYQPDFRQAIADSWPDSIDDSSARNDWNWKAEFNLPAMSQDMLLNLKAVRQAELTEE